jgi:hypothetical protein
MPPPVEIGGGALKSKLLLEHEPKSVFVESALRRPRADVRHDRDDRQLELEPELELKPWMIPPPSLTATGTPNTASRVRGVMTMERPAQL